MDLKTEIEIDSDILDYVPEFWKSREKDLTEIESRLSSDDFKTIARIGHTVKGVAAPFGYPTLGDLFRELEAHAGQGHKAEIKNLLVKIEDYYNTYSAPRFKN